MKTKPLCPFCGHESVRNGNLNTLKSGQKFLCPACGKCFSTFTGTVFHYQNHPPSVVAFVLELVVQFGLSYRQAILLVKKLFKVRLNVGILSLWRNKLGSLDLALEEEFDREWHCDEMFIRHEKRLPDGRKAKWFDYLWVVCDSKQHLIAIHLSNRRDIKSATAVLRKAKERAGFIPDVLITDDCLAYPRAIKKVFGRKVTHFTGHIQPDRFYWRDRWWSITNNESESLNSRLRSRLRRLRGYKTFGGGERFLNCLGVIWNCRLSGSLASALLSGINR